MEEFEIIFYETVDGKIPVIDFIDTLPKKVREKIFKTIDILKVKGISLREPYSKSSKKLNVRLGVKLIWRKRDAKIT